MGALSVINGIAPTFPPPAQLLDSPGHPEYVQSVRSLMEVVFKLANDAFSLQKFNRNTTHSVKKAVSLDLLLSGLVTSPGFRSKKQ